MDMSLESSGQSKVLSFEEFTAAQQGGMMPPTDMQPADNIEQPMDTEPIDQDLPMDGAGQDEITLADGPEEEAPVDEPTEAPTDEPTEVPVETPTDESTI